MKKLSLLLLLLVTAVPLFSQQPQEDVIVYINRLKKSTNSDKDFKVYFGDKYIGTFEGINPAVTQEAKGEWIVVGSTYSEKLVLRVTDKKGQEIDRLVIETFPGRSCFVEFNPAAGYGVKALHQITNMEGRKQFAETTTASVQIITPQIASRVWAEKGKLDIDDNEPVSAQAKASSQSKTEDFPVPLTDGRNGISVESTLGTQFQEEINRGKYYALIIGIQDYLDPNINDLDQPVKDAQALYDVLTKFYTFSRENVILLSNPRRQQITKALDDLVEKVTPDDNLLIFYAGHGHWDEKLKQGFWLPVDASEKNRGTWFSNADLKTYIGGINARHTLLITDACFGGSIFKTREAFTDASADIQELYRYPSRKAMTSGALNAVPDRSVFIEYLIKRLQNNDKKFISAEQLFYSFKTAVINNSANNQIPQFGEIRETGDEGGDFIFVRK